MGRIGSDIQDGFCRNEARGLVAMANDELDSPDESPMVQEFLDSPDNTNRKGKPNNRGHGKGDRGPPFVMEYIAGNWTTRVLLAASRSFPATEHNRFKLFIVPQ